MEARKFECTTCSFRSRVNSRDHDDQVADAGVSNDRVQLSFLIWFSFAPFTGPMAEEFGLSLAEIRDPRERGDLACAVRSHSDRLALDRWGAPTVFAIVLTYVGIFSIASAFAQSYAVFFVERLIVATAGITFVIGIQRLRVVRRGATGNCRGIYAGVGNAGAAGRCAHPPARVHRELERSDLRDELASGLLLHRDRLDPAQRSSTTIGEAAKSDAKRERPSRLRTSKIGSTPPPATERSCSRWRT